MNWGGGGAKAQAKSAHQQFNADGESNSDDDSDDDSDGEHCGNDMHNSEPTLRKRGRRPSGCENTKPYICSPGSTPPHPSLK